MIALLAGCSSGPEATPHGEFPVPHEHTGTASEALSSITRSEVIAYAEQWAAVKLPYCQSPNGKADPDTACSPTCQRMSNAQWDPYRSDCSGFVSWGWQLPAPGRVTSEFAPFDTAVSEAIQCTDMKPGDAANRDSGGHMVLFKKWVTPGKEAVFIEEPGCSSSEPYAHEFTSAVTCTGTDVDIVSEGAPFTAIRYTHIADDLPDAGAPFDAGDDAAAVARDAGLTHPGADGGAAEGADAGSGSLGGGGGPGSGTDAGIHGGGGSAGDNDGGAAFDDNGTGVSGCTVGTVSGRSSAGFGVVGLLGLVLASRRRKARSSRLGSGAAFGSS